MQKQEKKDEKKVRQTRPRSLKRHFRRLRKAGQHAQVEAEYYRDEARDYADQARKAVQSRVQHVGENVQNRIDSAATTARGLVNDIRSLDLQAKADDIKHDKRVQSTVDTLGERMEELAGRLEHLSASVRETSSSEGRAAELSQRAADALERSGNYLHSVAPRKEERKKAAFVREKLPVLLMVGFGAGAVTVWWMSRRR